MVAIQSGFMLDKESPTLEIHHRVTKLRNEGQDLVHFGFGQSPFPLPKGLRDGLIRYADKNHYLPTQGLPELRCAIACYHGKADQSEQIFVTPGSKQAIYALLQILEGPLIVPAPSWVSYGPQAKLLNKELHVLQCTHDEQYMMTAQSLNEQCKKLDAEQKILILNTPSNPTGRIIDSEELKQIADVCDKHNVIVISDEIYSKVYFENDKTYDSLSTYCPDRVISTNGLSKAFSAGGYRLGYAVIPKALMALKAPLIQVFSETFSAVSAPIQYAAADFYSKLNENRHEFTAALQTHQLIVRHGYDRFNDIGLEVPYPQGGFYLFVDFEQYRSELAQKGVTTSTQLANLLLEKHKVATLPGSAFYMPDNSLTLRISPVDYDGKAVLEHFERTNRISLDDLPVLAPKILKGFERIESLLAELRS